MTWSAGIDWVGLLTPRTPVLEIVLRGTITYLALVALLRFVMKREIGTLGITDLLVIVLIADAAQNAMADDYQSIPDGLLLVATIVGWSYLLDWLAFRFPLWRRILRPSRVQLVKDGRILERNLSHEKITREELESELRVHGCDDVSRVRAAYVESDGMISVIMAEGEGGGDGGDQKRRKLRGV